METMSAHSSFEEFCYKGRRKVDSVAGRKSGVKTRANSWHVWEVTEMIQPIGRRDGGSQ